MMNKLLIGCSFIFLVGCIKNQKEKTTNPITSPPSETGLHPLIDSIITNPEEKKFISDIRKIRKLKLVNCDQNGIHYLDEVKGEKVELKITLKPFVKAEHEIEYHNFQEKTSKNCLKVDGAKPRGGYYGCPSTEFDKIKFTIGGNAVDLGEHFENHYNPIMCKVYQENFNPNPLLTYSEDGYFYLYLMGGKGQDRFLTKFVSDGKSVTHSYFLNVQQLREINGFDKDFLGF